MTIDVHAHAVIPHYHRLLTDSGVAIPGYGKDAPPGLTGTVEDARIGAMDQAGVERQLLSPMFAPYVPDDTAAVRAARCINDAHAEMVGNHPNRLSAFAALPLPHINAALTELERCMDELGTIGVVLHCSSLGESVVAERFDPLYEELNRRRAVVFFHPCVDGLCSPLVTEWGLSATAGAVFEDTTIALHLIVRRIPDRFPDITFVIPHLGGALPMLLNRLDNQLPMSWPELTEAPSGTARGFYYDSVSHGSSAALRCAVDAFGADRILPGSDYPVLLPFESYCDTFDYIRQAGLPESALNAIMSTNAKIAFGEA